MRPNGISWRLRNRAIDYRPGGPASSGDHGCRCYRRGSLLDRVPSNFSVASEIEVFGGPLPTGSDLPVDGPWSTLGCDAHQIRYPGLQQRVVRTRVRWRRDIRTSLRPPDPADLGPLLSANEAHCFRMAGSWRLRIEPRPGGFSRRGRRPAGSFTRDRSTGNRCSRSSCRAHHCLARKQKFCRFIAGPSARRSREPSKTTHFGNPVGEDSECRLTDMRLLRSAFPVSPDHFQQRLIQRGIELCSNLVYG